MSGSFSLPYESRNTPPRALDDASKRDLVRATRSWFPEHHPEVNPFHDQ
jgi:hypothetical protein